MTVIRSAIRSAVRGAVRSALEDRFGGAWWYPGAALDVDFVNQRYYWGGAQRVQGDFTGWTGVTHTAGEGVTTAAARGITLDTTGWWTGTTGSMAASFKGISNPGVSAFIAELWNGTSNESARIYNSTTNWQFQISAGGGGQNVFTTAMDTAVKHAISGSWQTNSVKGAFDGAAYTDDTVATMPSSLTQFVVGASTHYVRRVVVLQSVIDTAANQALSNWLLTNG